MHDLCQSVLIINSALGHKQSTKIEGVVLNRVCILGIFCPKQGQGFKSSAAYLYPNIDRVSPPGLLSTLNSVISSRIAKFACEYLNTDDY